MDNDSLAHPAQCLFWVIYLIFTHFGQCLFWVNRAWCRTLGSRKGQNLIVSQKQDEVRYEAQAVGCETYTAYVCKYNCVLQWELPFSWIFDKVHKWWNHLIFQFNSFKVVSGPGIYFGPTTSICDFGRGLFLVLGSWTLLKIMFWSNPIQMISTCPAILYVRSMALKHSIFFLVWILKGRMCV